jgi:hypothetical protein
VERNENHPGDEAGSQRRGGMAPSRRRWWRALLRPVPVAALAGALVGAGTVAWLTESLPFQGDGRACWGAISHRDASNLVGGDFDVVEDPPTSTDQGYAGSCLLRGDDGQRVVLRVHSLGDTRQVRIDPALWAREFLHPTMTWLGGGVSGMASHTRGWILLPEGCDNDAIDGHLVVDIARAEPDSVTQRDAQPRSDRDLLARALTQTVNVTMPLAGCEGTLPEPSDLPEPPTRREAGNHLCGVEGLPGLSEDSTYSPVEQITRGEESDVRICGTGYDGVGDLSLRLATIEDPHIADALRYAYRGRGTRLDHPTGSGTISPSLSAFHATCQTGTVTFLIQNIDTLSDDAIGALLPPYVATEAERIGCGPLEIELPD